MANSPDEAALLRTWSSNAVPWTRAVRDGTIASRVEVTNAAILDVVRSAAPRTVLDVGCGEGWLVRALHDDGIDVTGVDGSPELIELGRAAGGGRYAVVSHETLATADLGRFDLVVANFSLLGEVSAVACVTAVAGKLTPDGRFVLQTVHPWVAVGDGRYTSGWRAGSWDGLGDGFVETPAWYFRTLADWLDLLDRAGLVLANCIEPTGADGRPRSLILIASAPGSAQRVVG